MKIMLLCFKHKIPWRFKHIPELSRLHHFLCRIIGVELPLVRCRIVFCSYHVSTVVIATLPWLSDELRVCGLELVHQINKQSMCTYVPES